MIDKTTRAHVSDVLIHDCDTDPLVRHLEYSARFRAVIFGM
jgi:hypothetical protein